MLPRSRDPPCFTAHLTLSPPTLRPTGHAALVTHGASPRRRARLDAVGAAGVATQEVRGPFDANVVAERGAEQFELPAAQPLTLGGSRTYRAMVLGEQHGVAVARDLGHVTLGAALARQCIDATADRRIGRDRGSVVRELCTHPLLDHAFEPIVADRGSDRADQFDGEVVVAIGEQFDCDRRETPAPRWPPSTCDRSRTAFDQTCVTE